MRMDRLTLCNEICKIIRIARIDPEKNFLTKRELLCIHSHLSAMESQCNNDQTDN
jgi:GR25 family glycosyltransferase involved in LPS biosynthesis